VRRVLALALALFVLAHEARAEDLRLASPGEYVMLPYQNGESWPLRNFQGLDFGEAFVPVAAARQSDWGRVVLDWALPVGLLATSLTLEHSDGQTTQEIVRWRWVGADKKQDNYPILFGLIGVATASVLLPAPEDEFGFSWSLRFDRVTVLGLGMLTAAIERELLVPVFNKPRPDGSSYTSKNDARPSGHAASAFSSAAFLSNILRDTLRPQDEPDIPVRIAYETLSALPYLPATYVLLSRVKARKHDLTDTLLGAGLGAFTMNLFYSWSFTRREQSRGWIDSLQFSWYVDDRGAMLAFSGRF
jgi:membrane-associated phospholipid phosphatase